MSIPSFLQLERLCLRAWPALEEMDYDGWRLRAAQGYTGRANSVAPLAHGGLPVAEKIAHVEAWYTARQLPAKFRLTEFARRGTLDLHLRSLGYRFVDPVATIRWPCLRGQRPRLPLMCPWMNGLQGRMSTVLQCHRA